MTPLPPAKPRQMSNVIVPISIIQTSKSTNSPFMRKAGGSSVYIIRHGAFANLRRSTIDNCAGLRNRSLRFDRCCATRPLWEHLTASGRGRITRTFFWENLSRIPNRTPATIFYLIDRNDRIVLSNVAVSFFFNTGSPRFTMVRLMTVRLTIVWLTMVRIYDRTKRI